MAMMDADAIRAAYLGEFQDRLKADNWKSWRANYIAFVRHVRDATDAQWMTPAFQESLWDRNPVSGVGSGSSVTVRGAYTDKTLAKSLRDAFLSTPPQNVRERGAYLQRLNDDTLKALQPYNERRPQARLTRLLAALFPLDVSCILNWDRLRDVMRALGLTPLRTGFIANHPIVLDHLRNVVGAPSSLDEEVEQSIFSWFLWQKTTGEQRTEVGAIVAGPRPDEVTNVPRVSLMPPGVQRKGLTYVSGNVPLLVEIVRECEQGISRPDLIAAIQREAPRLTTAGSAGSVISQAQGGLGLISYGAGSYRPTERGLELLTAPAPEQVLQPLLVGRVFGVGHLLLALKDAPGGEAKRELMKHLTALIPTRKSLWAGGELVSWVIAAKLAKKDGDQVSLTEDGIDYAEALPDDFLQRWRLDAAPDDEEPAEQSDPSEGAGYAESNFVPAAWDALRTRFADGSLSSRLILPLGWLEELHAALHASPRKRFVLLSGLSGTGKTSVARAYAEAYCRALDLSDLNARYAQVAVRPDWTDPTGILGFINALTDPPTFQAAGALRILLAADADRSRPYFLCLDEMNLARVEHYFAPFLSGMEGEASELTLHSEPRAIDNIPPNIRWPANLFIFGTVNMDESTHAFSDKVLDRAFTFEFWDVDLEAWQASKQRSVTDANVVARVSDVLRSLYGCLYPARRHFGYRTADEVLAYCLAGAPTAPLEKLLDSAILMKVLPRVRGDDSGPLADTLKSLSAVLDSAGMPRSRAKVLHMQNTLERLGQTRFWS